MSSYSKFYQFGTAMNANVKNPLDQSNPLTYCITPTFNAQFLHGSTSTNLLYTPQGPGCMNYMSERCAGVYDGFCRAYTTLNQDTSWPNTGVIDSLTYSIAKDYMRVQPTTGQNMIRNAAERRFLYYPGIVSTSEPFDPNVANSPQVVRYDNSYSPGIVQFQNLDNPANVDNDPLIDELKRNWQTSLDVLVKIYKGYKEKSPQIRLYPSKFELFLLEKAPVFEDFICYLNNVPNYNYSTENADYTPELYSTSCI